MRKLHFNSCYDVAGTQRFGERQLPFRPRTNPVKERRRALGGKKWFSNRLAAEKSYGGGIEGQDGSIWCGDHDGFRHRHDDILQSAVAAPDLVEQLSLAISATSQFKERHGPDRQCFKASDFRLTEAVWHVKSDSSDAEQCVAGRN
jgi:hypothetical protein